MRITGIRVWRIELPLIEGSYRWAGSKSVEVFDTTLVALDALTTNTNSQLALDIAQQAGGADAEQVRALVGEVFIGRPERRARIPVPEVGTGGQHDASAVAAGAGCFPRGEQHPILADIVVVEDEGVAPIVQSYRTLIYCQLSDTADVYITDYRQDGVGFRLQGKYIGPLRA